MTARSPVDGATDISPLSAVSAGFSQPLDPATLDSSSFRLEGPGGAAVPATLGYDAVTRTATLTPGSALAPPRPTRRASVPAFAANRVWR